MGTPETANDLESVYRRYYPLIREKCRRMLEDPDEASDVAQDTFVRFWRARPQALAPNQATAWLYRTSTHLAVDRIRRRAPRAALGAVVLARADESDSSASLELRRFFVQVASRVPRQELEVAVLYRADGLDQNELADVTGLSDRTVRRLLARFDERIGQLSREGT